MAKYIDSTGFSYLWGKLKDYFVRKETGKGLSTEDYTTAEKTKLSGLSNTEIVDNLTSTDTTKALSAKQGKVLSDLIPQISVSITDDATSDTKGASPKSVKTYVDTKVSGLYKPSGSLAFASLPTASADKLGNVYNVTDSFTTTNDFVEGSGKSYPGGTNVVIVEPVLGTYMFDVLAGFVDLSSYYNTSNLVTITDTEIDTVLAS